MNQRVTYIFIIVLVLLLLGGVIGFTVWQGYVPDIDSSKNNDQQQGGLDDNLIGDRFANKIVYKADSSVDIESLRADCQSRGGQFDECGSACSDSAEQCIQVCAYVCRLEENGGGLLTKDENKWRQFAVDYLDISLDYPPEMTYETLSDHHIGVQFNYWGPTQRQGTELFDGISFIIQKREYDQNSLRDYVESEIKNIEPIGKVTGELSAITIAGLGGYSFTAVTLGEHTKIYLPSDDDQALYISYTSPDPEDIGYNKVVDNILDSIEIQDNQVSLDIIVDQPKINSSVSSPLEIRGLAKGNWFFEATMPVKLTDGDNNVIANHYVTAQGEWMTEDPVPFSGQLEFSAPQDDSGFLIFQKANPSGLPENDQEYKLPINF